MKPKKFREYFEEIIHANEDKHDNQMDKNFHNSKINHIKTQNGDLPPKGGVAKWLMIEVVVLKAST